MLEIRAAEPRDMSDIASVQAAAFSRDELFAYLYPSLKDYPLVFRHDWLHRLRKRMAEPSMKVMVAELDNDVVGCAVWDWRGDKADAAGWTSDDLFKKIERSMWKVESKYWDFINPALNKQALQHFMTSTEYDFYQELADSGFLHLASLAVNPKHQGKGVGKALIQWGLNEGAKYELPVTLEASITGRLVYAKQGFVVIEKHDLIDGFDGIAMLYEPPALKGKWLEYDDDGKTAKLKKSVA